MTDVRGHHAGQRQQRETRPLCAMKRPLSLSTPALSAKQLTARLQATGLSPEQLSGVLLTHEHGDHTSALKVFLIRNPLPVFCNSLTARALQHAGVAHNNWKLFATGSGFFTLAPSRSARSQCLTTPLTRWALHLVGWRVLRRPHRSRLCATRLVFEMLRGIHALLIETNHDEELLQATPGGLGPSNSASSPGMGISPTAERRASFPSWMPPSANHPGPSSAGTATRRSWRSIQLGRLSIGENLVSTQPSLRRAGHSKPRPSDYLRTPAPKCPQQAWRQPRENPQQSRDGRITPPSPGCRRGEGPRARRKSTAPRPQQRRGNRRRSEPA